jgi:hypothetical protein
MKKGTKIQRIGRSSYSCKVIMYHIYTMDGFSKDGKWIRLKERRNTGYSWDIKNFEILEE